MFKKFLSSLSKNNSKHNLIILLNLVTLILVIVLIVRGNKENFQASNLSDYKLVSQYCKNGNPDGHCIAPFSDENTGAPNSTTLSSEQYSAMLRNMQYPDMNPEMMPPEMMNAEMMNAEMMPPEMMPPEMMNAAGNRNMPPAGNRNMPPGGSPEMNAVGSPDGPP